MGYLNTTISDVHTVIHTRLTRVKNKEPLCIGLSFAYMGLVDEHGRNPFRASWASLASLF